MHYFVNICVYVYMYITSLVHNYVYAFVRTPFHEGTAIFV